MTPPIYVVSGATGASGQQLVRTVLAQFENADIPIILVPFVADMEPIHQVIAQALQTGGIIVHTLANADLRGNLTELARRSNLSTIDLMGPLMFQLTGILGQQPSGKPGQYRRLREDYFHRIEAIEYTVDHDDGLKPQDLYLADIVLTGVSRVGKTPLSMYLSTRGWKVANVPLVPGIEPPEELFEVERGRVVGLTIKPDQLVAYRSHRQQRLGVSGAMAYSNLDDIETELEYAKRVFRRGHFPVIDITDKPIEESAEEVVAHVSRHME